MQITTFNPMILSKNADEIIKLHKGTLNIDSIENVGTTVTISIPIVPPKSEEDSHTDETEKTEHNA